MKPTLLTFHITGKKLSGLRVIALRLGMRVLVPTADQLGLTLGEILAGTAGAEPPEEALTEEMVVFCGVTSRELDSILAAMRQQRVSVALKAVLTETNQDWTPAQLLQQLHAERDALAAGETAHEA